MAKLWAIISREYNERVRTTFFVISTLFAPLLFGALMFVPAWLALRTKATADVGRIVVIDASGTSLGTQLASALNGGPMGDSTKTRVHRVTPAELPAAEREATAAVARKEAKGYLVLDDKTVAGQEARYSGTNASATFDMNALERAVRAQVMELRLERAGIDEAQAEVLSRMRLTLKTERLSSRGKAGSGDLNAIFGIAVGLLLYMSIFLYGQNVLRGVMEEKQTRVAEVVMSSVPATKLLAGKVLGVGAVGVTQLVLWMAGSWAIVQGRAPIMARLGLPNVPFSLPSISPGMIALLVLYFLLGYVFYAALFAAVGAMVNSEQEAQQVQLPVALLLVSTAMCIQPILLAPESRLAHMMSLIPFSAPVAVPLRLTLTSVPTREIALSIAILVASCFVAVWIAARIYRVGLLMYGKRPTLPELARWVRQG
ncbi:MAG TPA: ABC transporter permease [Gemmatimonadaceae bacterium]|nr:ABC transporter permease [Gemmatimonadaceae bacterium]